MTPLFSGSQSGISEIMIRGNPYTLSLIPRVNPVSWVLGVSPCHSGGGWVRVAQGEGGSVSLRGRGGSVSLRGRGVSVSHRGRVGPCHTGGGWVRVAQGEEWVRVTQGERGVGPCHSGGGVGPCHSGTGGLLFKSTLVGYHQSHSDLNKIPGSSCYFYAYKFGLKIAKLKYCNFKIRKLIVFSNQMKSNTALN